MGPISPCPSPVHFMVSFPEVREADKRVVRSWGRGEEWAQEKGRTVLHCVFRENQDAKLETIHEKFLEFLASVPKAWLCNLPVSAIGAQGFHQNNLPEKIPSTSFQSLIYSIPFEHDLLAHGCHFLAFQPLPSPFSEKALLKGDLFSRCLHPGANRVDGCSLRKNYLWSFLSCFKLWSLKTESHIYVKDMGIEICIMLSMATDSKAASPDFVTPVLENY